MDQVMQALAYMHAWKDPESGQTRPIIHRDIKPANIKRTPEGRVVLVDFGIAKVDAGTATATAVSAKALTPGFAPLEQYGGGTDARSDIYSLGATLFALLTGAVPPTATDMAMSAGKQRTPLAGSLKTAPPRVAKVIERAMQSLPQSRFQSMAEMYQALFARPLPDGATGGAGRRPSSDGNRRELWPALVLGVGALLVVAIGRATARNPTRGWCDACRCGRAARRRNVDADACTASRYATHRYAAHGVGAECYGHGHPNAAVICHTHACEHRHRHGNCHTGQRRNPACTGSAAGGSGCGGRDGNRRGRSNRNDGRPTNGHGGGGYLDGPGYADVHALGHTNTFPDCFAYGNGNPHGHPDTHRCRR
jgi:hypothetical protein